MNALLAELKAGAALATGRKDAPRTAAQGSVDFPSMLKGALNEVNASQGKAETLAREFQLGNPRVSLEEAMVALQKASLSLQFLVQVRNKVITAYHDIMNMQV